MPPWLPALLIVAAVLLREGLRRGFTAWNLRHPPQLDETLGELSGGTDDHDVAGADVSTGEEHWEGSAKFFGPNWARLQLVVVLAASAVLGWLLLLQITGR